MKLSIQDLVFITLALQEYENNTYQSDKLTDLMNRVDSETRQRWTNAHKETV